MVPDLVVLEVLERQRVEPAELGVEVAVEGEERFEAVQPHGVVRRVLGDDVGGEEQDAGRLFIGGHDGAKVGHRFGVGGWVGDCGEGGEGGGAGAVEEGDRGDVGPEGGDSVFGGHGG